jgi:hypothetical protein
MSRRIALPLLASVLALMTLAATIIPFEADAIALAGRPAWDRLLALQPPVIATALLTAIAAFACWRAPRTAIAPILLALALGALGGTATLIALPEVLGTAHARLAASTY